MPAGNATMNAHLKATRGSNQPLPLPARCEAVFAVIDPASDTGADNDATAVTFFALDRVGQIPLLILDWDTVQIEGALLAT
jgi:hypothetical protein